jgi:hypothetical protein
MSMRMRSSRRAAWAVAVSALMAGAPSGASAQQILPRQPEFTPAAIQAALDGAYQRYRGLQEGKNADYIPALARVDPGLFGIALVTADGKVYTAGDPQSEVSIQSISKVFTMAEVIREQGAEAVSQRIGVDATGCASTRS